MQYKLVFTNNILNMRRFIVYGILMFTVLAVNAQGKVFKIEDFTNPKLRPSTLSGLQWIEKEDAFTYVKNNCLIKFTVASDKADTIVKLDDINKGYVNYYEDKLKLSRFPSITWINSNCFIFQSDTCFFRFYFKEKEIQLINYIINSAENIDIEGNNNYIAFTKDNNLYISKIGVLRDGIDKNSKPNEGVVFLTYPVNSDTNKNIVYGQAAHRNEFGIEKGTFWSPKGNLLAFYRMDQTMVTDYPLVDINTRIAGLNNIKYPMAGMKSHHVTVGVLNPETGESVFLKTGEPAEQYLTNITWSPDEKYIYIAVLNRGQNHMKLNQYDAATGDFIKTLFEEENEKYVEPERGLYFMKTNPAQFIWFSERDGYDHLYLYNTDGKLIRQLTKGEWVVTKFLGFDNDESHALFLSTKESPLEQNIYSVNIKTLEIKKISADKGTHNAVISGDGKYLIDYYSNLNTGIEYKIFSTEGKFIRSVYQDKNPLKDYKMGETSEFTIKSRDNTDLYCRMIKPIDFDPNKKYPVIVYVYGGTHVQLVTESWMGGGDLFLNYMAQKGYVIFTLDNRGSANRGLTFEQAIFRNLGTLEVKDQIDGVNYLKSLNFVDTAKIGVYGWSYGGFMTISMMLKNPGVFKVAVAGGPVIDWQYYEIMYGERYMDTPEENPEGYKNASLLNYVDNLTGKLMIIHGGIDPTVVWQNSLRFIDECIKRGKQVDYFVYPCNEHSVGGKNKLHLYKKISQYFDDYLKSR